MSKRKEIVHGRNGEPADNPIISAGRQSLQGKQLVAVTDDWESLSPALLSESVRVTFNDDAIMEIGRLVCLSLLTGDRRIIKMVRDAVKQSDHLFNRDREPVLVKDVLRYLPSLMRSGLDIVAIKEEIEKRSNRGKPLQQYKWNRLRKALHLRKLPTGAAAIGYERQSRRNSGTKQR
jgi:hypothetical protein